LAREVDYEALKWSPFKVKKIYHTETQRLGHCVNACTHAQFAKQAQHYYKGCVRSILLLFLIDKIKN